MNVGITLEQYRRGVRLAHTHLSESEDGMTSYELHKITGIPRGQLQPILENNPLFYVDRWQISPRNKLPGRIWMAVPINNPGDCPRPNSF